MRSTSGLPTIRKQSSHLLQKHCVTGPSDEKRNLRRRSRRSRRINRPRGFLVYFCKAACQFNTTVMGV